MPGYIIGQLREITDVDAFGAYQGAAIPVVRQYGGKLLMNSSKIDAANGDWSPEGMVVSEFESVEQARKFYDSPEYQAVFGQRFDSADSAVIIVDGD